MIAWLITFINILTMKAYRTKREAIRRRANYEAIKAEIVNRHLAGFGGMALNKKYDFKDLQSFKPPMYQVAQNAKREPLIFWRKDLMTEEVGPPQTKHSDQIEKRKSNVKGIYAETSNI